MDESLPHGSGANLADLSMPARGARSPKWLSWTGLVYYGETVGFLFAWVVGIAALALSAGSSEPLQPAVDQVAAVDRPDSDRIE